MLFDTSIVLRDALMTRMNLDKRTGARLNHPLGLHEKAQASAVAASLTASLSVLITRKPLQHV